MIQQNLGGAIAPPPRPKVTNEMILKASKAVSLKLHGISAMDIERRYHHPMDGYELALYLTTHDACDVSREDMETLDEVESLVDELLKEAEKAWFTEHNIQPPLPIGARIQEGIIAGIYEYGVAQYRVKQTGCTEDGRYLIVKFEDAVEVAHD